MGNMNNMNMNMNVMNKKHNQNLYKSAGGSDKSIPQMVGQKVLPHKENFYPQQNQMMGNMPNMQQMNQNQPKQSQFQKMHQVNQNPNVMNKVYQGRPEEWNNYMNNPNMMINNQSQKQEVKEEEMKNFEEKEKSVYIYVKVKVSENNTEVFELKTESDRATLVSKLGISEKMAILLGKKIEESIDISKRLLTTKVDPYNIKILKQIKNSILEEEKNTEGLMHSSSQKSLIKLYHDFSNDLRPNYSEVKQNDLLNTTL